LNPVLDTHRERRSRENASRVWKKHKPIWIAGKLTVPAQS
jgi:hypothetical protein